MTPKLLQQAGTLLFGQFYRRPFEVKYGVDNRTLRRMLKGAAPIPVGLAREIETDLRDTANKIDGVLEALAT